MCASEQFVFASCILRFVFSPSHVGIPRRRTRTHDDNGRRTRTGSSTGDGGLRRNTGIGRCGRIRAACRNEGQCDDTAGKLRGGETFGTALCIASVLIEIVAVVAELERRIEDAVAAAPQVAIGTAERIGREGVLLAQIARFAEIDSAISTERRLRSDLLRTQAFPAHAQLAIPALQIGRAIKTAARIAEI